MGRPKSRDAQQDAALVLLLKALPDARLEGILEALGVITDDKAGPRKDTRRCRQCGRGYVACRAADQKAPTHEWDPVPPNRSDA